MSNRSATATRDLDSPAGFDETLGRITAAIERAGLTIFARIDHAANARAAGLAMPPAVVVIYGNPDGGTAVMLAAPAAALDLPLRVLVRERAAGGVVVSYHPVAATLTEAGVPADLAARLEPGQALITAALGA